MFRGRKYANVTSTMALVVALGGTGAYAANTIGSSDIKNNSIRSADIKNKEVKNADLASNAVTGAKVKAGSLDATDFKAGSLPAGAAGAKGATGATGATGAKGDKGDTGPSDGVFVRGTEIVGFTGTDQTVATANLPAGSWMVWAKTVVNNNGAAQIDPRCDLNVGGTLLDRNHAGAIGIPIAATGGLNRTTFTLMGARTLAADGTATLVCTSQGGASGNFIRPVITAVRIGTLTGP